MTRSKLSASDREELIRLFKETTETITSLANRFQVSVSTARRVLKTQIEAAEYEAIVTSRLEDRQGQKGESAGNDESVETVQEIGEDDAPTLSPLAESASGIAKPILKPQRRSRRRASVSETQASLEDLEEIFDSPCLDSPREVLDGEPELDQLETLEPASTPSRRVEPPIKRINIPTREAFEYEEEEDDDLFDDLLEESEEEAATLNLKSSQDLYLSAEQTSHLPLEILPIQSAALPHQCYLVVDRSSELITCPLKDFSELGDVPTEEESSKTLPIFENHKIASRFSRRSQRIIKIPNSDILKKTYPLLNAKGVERILFAGKVFSLAVD